MNKRRVGFEIRNINNLIKRDIEKNRDSDLKDLSAVQGMAIGYFYDNMNRDIFQRDFEKHFSIRRSTATKILQTMEKNGFVTRAGCKTDARLKKILLTDKGIKIHQAIISDINEREKRIAYGISDAELKTFFNILDKIKANLEGNND